MKKILSILGLFLLSLIFISCTNNKNEFSIVCMSYSEYDWVKNLVKDTNIEVSYLCDNGSDIHSYQVKPSDKIKVIESKMFVYPGGEDFEYLDEAFRDAKLKINLLDLINDKLIEDANNGEEDDELEYDNHTWLSLKNAKSFITYIKNKLIEIDEVNKDKYINNYNNYYKELDNLDKLYENELNKKENKTLVFADRFPFAYLCKDYNINYFAAFKGCSSEIDAKAETITFLANKIDELDLKYVMTIEGNANIKNAVINATKNKNQEVLVLNSLQGVTKSNLKENDSYINFMNQNLNVLKKAFEVGE